MTNHSTVGKSPSSRARKAQPDSETSAAGPRGGEEGTRQRVLAMARAEFAAKGLAGARVDEIAHRAGINKQAIYYHFGNKDDLFRATLEACYAEILRQNTAYASTAATTPPEQAMTTLIEHMFDRIHRDAEVVVLIMDENRYRGEHLTNRELISSSDDAMIEHIRKILAEGIRQGVFVAGIDPTQLYLDLLSLCIHYFSNIYTLSAVTGASSLTNRLVDSQMPFH